MLRFSAILLASLFMVGCDSQPRGEIHGTVSYKDVPVQYAIVMVFGDDQRVYRADTDQSGSFRIPGIPYGKLRVAVQRPMRESEGPPIDDHLNAPGARTDSVDNRPKVPTIPSRYADPATSNLLVDVADEKQQFDIELNQVR